MGFLFYFKSKIYFAFLITIVVFTGVTNAQNSEAWVASGSGAATTWSTDNGETGVELVTITASATDYSVSADTNNPTTTLNDFQTAGEMLACSGAYSEPTMVGNSSLSIRHTFPDSAFITFKFSENVINPVIHFDRLGGGGGPGNTTTSSLLRVVNSDITITELSENDTHFVTNTTNKTITRLSGVVYNSTPAECGPPLDGTAAGSVRLNGTFNTITFEIAMNPDSPASVNDRFEIAFSDVVADSDRDGVPNATDICNGFDDNADIDNDNVPDGCDVDDDNDGILDETELECSNSVQLKFGDNSNVVDGTVEGDNVGGPNVYSGYRTANSVPFDVIITVSNASGSPTAGNNQTADNNLDGIVGLSFSGETISIKFVHTVTQNPLAIKGFTFNISDFETSGTFEETIPIFRYVNSNNQNIIFSNGNWNNWFGVNNIPFGDPGSNLSTNLDGNLTTNYAGGGGNQPNKFARLDVSSEYITEIEVTQFNSGGGCVFGWLNNDLEAYCDTDKDGTPNYLDNDSDNDGCFDSLEGADNINNSEVDMATGQLTGAVDTFGVPNNVNQTTGQLAGNSIFSALGDSFEQCPRDSDNDGVLDTDDECNGFDDALNTDLDDVANGCDVDDDNDGILDTVEYECGNNISLNFGANTNTNNGIIDADISNGPNTFTGYQTSTGIPFDVIITVSNAAESVASGNNATTNGFVDNIRVAKFSGETILIKFENTNTGEPIGIKGFIFNISDLETALPFDESLTSFKYKTADRGDFSFGNGLPWTGWYGSNNIPFGTAGSNISSNVNGELITNYAGLSGDQNNKYARLDLTSQYVTEVEVTQINRNGGAAFGWVNTNLTTFCDTDNDGIPDYLDTDSDNDGCSDAVEGSGTIQSFQLTDLVGGSTNASGQNNTGSLGNLGTDAASDGSPLVNATDTVGIVQLSTTAVLDEDDTLACQADLRLIKTVNTSIVKTGSTIVYSLTLTNDGGAVATGVQVTDVLPAGLTYSSDNSAATSTTYTSNIWDVGNLSVNQTISLEITATVNGAGAIVNTAEVRQSNQTDTDSTPNNGN